MANADQRFDRAVRFYPAFDKRNDDPAKNYGIHCVDVGFFLKGPLGVVQFTLFSGWHLPHVADELERKSPTLRYPMATDLGYHSPTPRYEGQTVMRDKCDLLGCACYYDGSSLNAEPVLDRLLREGDKGVWAALEDFYHNVFERQQEAA